MFEEVLLDKQYDIIPPPEPIRFIIDAGANAGYTSVYYANRYPAARIIALEPDDSNFNILRQNTQAYPQITPLKAALWVKPAKLKISNPSAPNCAFQVEEVSQGDSLIEAVTIEQLMRQHESGTISILKIDIEGAEKELFEHSSCQSWLPHVSQLVIELHDRFKPGCRDALNEALRSTRHTHQTRGENDIYTFIR